MFLDADLLTPDSLPMPLDRPNNFWYVRQSAHTAFVFLHGIFSDSRSCWLSSGARPVFWPDLVRTDPRLGAPSVYLAGYYTALDAGDFSVAQCAREVIDALGRPETDGAPAVLDLPNLVLICHSTGGIVARNMLERYRDQFRDKAVGVALIASPSLGSAWANVAGLAAKYYNQRLAQQLQWRGDTLEDIHGRFRDLVNDRAEQMPGLFGMEASENKMIFRDRIPAVIRWLLPPRLKVVTTLSAGQYFGEVKVLRGTDHFTTVKPDSLHHPSHEFLVNFQLEFRETAAFRRDPTASVTDQPGTGAAPAVTGSGGAAVAADDIEEGEWPQAPESTTRLYLAAAGSGAPSDVTVVGCVVLDDPKAADVQFGRAVDEWLRDPHLRRVPEAHESIRRRRFAYDQLDPDVRRRLVQHLSVALFEAYVAYSRGGPASTLKALASRLLFDRIRATRPRALAIEVAPELPMSIGEVRQLVGELVDRINEEDRQRIQSPPSVAPAVDTQVGPIMARLTCHLVRHRLLDPDAVESRAFDYVYPQKLRVMHDVTAGVFYSRDNPFPG